MATTVKDLETRVDQLNAKWEAETDVVKQAVLGNLLIDVLARLKTARKSEEAADEMPMSGDDTARPQKAISSPASSGGVSHVGASLGTCNLVRTGCASDVSVCGDVQARAPGDFRPWTSASLRGLFGQPQFRRGAVDSSAERLFMNPTNKRSLLPPGSMKISF